MCASYVAVRPIHRGWAPQWGLMGLLAVIPSASADPTTKTTPDAPAREAAPVVPATHFRPSWDLDGVYLWLGPVGAAGRLALEALDRHCSASRLAESREA